MSSGSPDFYHKDNVYIKQSDINVPVSIEDSKVTVDANVTNSQLDVNIAGQNNPIDVNVDSGSIDANVTNSSINTVIQDCQVTLPVQGSVDANITNSELAVKVDSGSIDANVTNSNINTIIQDSQVVLKTQGGGYKGKALTLGYETVGANDTSVDGMYVYKAIFATPPLVIKQIRIYVNNTDTADHDFEIAFCTGPGEDPLYTTTVTASAGQAAWYYVPIYVYWPFPTLYVRVSCDDYHVKFYYDDTGLTDIAYYFSDSSYDALGGELTLALDVVSLETLTVPISGHVKSFAAGFDSTNKKYRDIAVHSDGVLKGLRKVTKSANTDLLSIDAGATVTILTVSGRGTVKYAKFRCEYDAFQVRIYVDGNLIDWGQLGFTFKPSWVYGDEQRFKSGFLSCTNADTTNNIYIIEMVQEIRFSSEFEIVVYNPDTAAHNIRVDFLLYEVEE